jgi:hypothetical protein
MPRPVGACLSQSTLAEIFQEGDPKVTRDSEGYWLESADLDPYIDDGARLQQEATALLNLRP